MIREIHTDEITNAVERLCIKANRELNTDIKSALERACANEPFAPAKEMLSLLCENAVVAREEKMPICQDTGMAIVFMELGQDVHLVGDPPEDAVNEGVRRGYEKGYLRKSVVGDPIKRVNTNDNTPAVLHLKMVPGDKVKITVAPKGFGSENMSRIGMLKPSDGIEGVKRFVVETVQLANANPCPPMVIGVGIGGSFEKAAMIAKEALGLPVDGHNEDPYYAALEEELLELVNETGIGPQGFGGRTTALGVRVKTYATHIAGLPVAVNISCHVTRHAEEII